MPVRLLKFAVTGVGSTAIHVVLAWSLITFGGWSPSAGNGLAYLVATAFSCVLNTRWTFGAFWSIATICRFLAATGLMLLVSMSIAALAQRAGLPPLAGIACIVAIVPVLTFLIHRNWTYR